jgi:hypothetical protein
MFIAMFKHCYCIVVASRPGRRLEVEANSYRRIGEPTEAPTETEERVKFSCHDSTRRLCASLCNLAKNMKELRNMTNMTYDSMMKKCHRYRSI